MLAVTHWGRSLMNIKNSRSPSTVLWGYSRRDLCGVRTFFVKDNFLVSFCQELLDPAGNHRYNHYIAGNRNILKLDDRGIFQTLFPEGRSHELHRALLEGTQCMYCGFDPTADSLHVGHLLTIMALLHCQRGGHSVIALIGGATAKIGDPSGRSTERAAMNEDTILHNVSGIHRTLDDIFMNHEEIFWQQEKTALGNRKILNNADWYNKINLIDFLSSTGRHFRMGTMLGRQSVTTRLSKPEGMSFTEFCYQIFQAYDWLHLHNTEGCRIQVGGNDQTGNIVSGHELISRVQDVPVWGLTVPLITSTTGDKLGKTAGNAVWLNPSKTPPFELYQYFIRMPDSDMKKYLNLFTFFNDKVLSDILTKHNNKPENRYAQKKLAEEVTKLVHGKAGLLSAERCTEALFNGSAEKLAMLSDDELNDLFRNTPVTELYLDPGTTVFDVVMKAKCFSRAVDAERVIKAGGVYINHQRAEEGDYVLIPGQHILPNGITLIRIGKKNYYLVKWLETGTLGNTRR
ncbi:hypothetical protein LSH36_129g03024 [Paralvinella palmiformis]|uniref:Tyrosine--tRNA ligase n=1 Tax=Paralvinella palmiformis TaxID=53620 RepID=A0AAD9JYL6_9ANNE|nr:hypothetical protein LSH36_129g03024 [Paralvinella palmiformis]